jgi:hypothetical protein
MNCAICGQELEETELFDLVDGKLVCSICMGYRYTL